MKRAAWRILSAMGLAEDYRAYVAEDAAAMKALLGTDDPDVVRAMVA